ncbi:MAG: hypothetical protein OXI73_04350, partial [Rhodospirillales bacterium]|nr:hypothetical protein [Rhodospirillales bacterium]
AGAENPPAPALELLELRQRRSEFLIRCDHAGLSAWLHKFNVSHKCKYIPSHGCKSIVLHIYT